MLTTLGLEHADELEVMLSDFDADPTELHGYFCERNWAIDRAVAALDAWARGDELPDGWVPCTTWFWRADGALQGVINVRHELSDGLRRKGGHIGYSVAPAHRRKGVATAMLGAVLDECRKLGLDKTLLTVDSSNVGSWRAIEHHGGVLEREEPIGDPPVPQRWYWIDLIGGP